METGQTLILSNLEEIHESLYDMLNQRYTFIKNSGKMYCRIALGSNSQVCFVDPSFKVLVIATKKDAHEIASDNAIPIAFLNRFEKQLISYHSSLSTNNLRFLYKLKPEICDRYCLDNMSQFKNIFPGFCSDTFASLILNVMNAEQNENINDQKVNYDEDDDDDYYMEEHKLNNVTEKPENMMQKCCDMLLDVTLTESLIQSAVNNKNSRKKQFLTDYIPTLQQLIENNIQPTKVLIVLTFDFENQLDKDARYFDKTEIKKMNEFAKSDHFEKYLYKYLTGNHTNNNLLLQYRHSDVNHYIHIKHIIESKLHHWNKKNRNIILLVHLYRNENLCSEFPLIFCKSSKLVFLDSLSQNEPIKIDSFTHYSIKDVCKQRGIELLQKTFYIALSHLHFSNKINVKKEIKKIDYLLSNNNNDCPVQKLIFDRFLKLLSPNKINRNIGEIVCKSISKNDGWTRGSFYERLNNFIDCVGVIAMIRILQTLYTNYNMDILQTHNTDNDNVFNLFVLLYSQFDLIEDNNMLDVNIEAILDERPNKLFVKNDYQASFPFSDKIHFWCNSQKTKIQTLIAQNNEMKSEYEAKQDEKDEVQNDYDMLNDSDTEIDMGYVKVINQNQYQMNISDRLKGEMESVWPSFVCELSINIAELYAKDLILLNEHQLQINQSCPNELICLGARLLIIATKYFNNSELDYNQGTISIAELETMMWNKLEFVKHMIAICSISTENEMIEIYNDANQSLQLTLIIDGILERVLNSLDVQMYANHNMYSILNSIKYVIDQFNDKMADDIVPLFSKYHMIRIQLIALKYALIELDITELYQIFNNKVSLLDYDTLCESFELLWKSIKNESAPKEKICNQIVYDLLSLINNKNIEECDERSILSYAQFLIDILCKLDLIIGVENAQTIKWNKNTENEIVRKLFAVLSLETFKSDDIIEQIQNTNKELAGLIIQVMSRDKADNRISKKINYAKSQNDFDKQLNIITPLIEQFNKDIYKKVTNAVNITHFFRFYNFGNKFPILKKLKAQNETFWNLDQLPQIAHWIEMIHGRYMGTISENGCNILKMNDVFEQCKLNKYGDQNEWIKLFTQYKNAMNSISNAKLPNTNHNISISSSLMGTNGNKTIRNNLKVMQNMINIHNNFFNGHKIIKCNLFDIKPNQLINKQQILNIIRSNARPWICYDSKNKLLPKTYLTFNINRIENEIKHQCIHGKTRLNVKYQNFECIGSKNMLRLIQSIKINQNILNYEVWHTFDSQFETNVQRKKALNIVEDVIRLLTSSKSNNNRNRNDFQVIFDEDSDDGKDDEKDEQRNNILLETHVVVHDPNISLCKVMRTTLRMNENKCQLFNAKIRLKHIQSLWSALVKRIDGEITQYQDVCYVCQQPISIQTPIELECCDLRLHYECLKQYIQSGFGNNGTRIMLRQLRCLMCRNEMRHKAANELFRNTQILYNKVEQIGLQQLRTDNKLNDPAVVNRNGEFYNNPSGYAMQIYAFFLCNDCGEPYFFGSNECGDDEEENDINAEQRLCQQCIDRKYSDWKASAHVQTCPNCGVDIEKNQGCNHMTCRPPGGCGHQFCWLCLRPWNNHGQCIPRR